MNTHDRRVNALCSLLLASSLILIMDCERVAPDGQGDNGTVRLSDTAEEYLEAPEEEIRDASGEIVGKGWKSFVAIGHEDGARVVEIAATEVTRGAWQYVLGVGAGEEPGEESMCLNCPVEEMTVFEIVSFLNALSVEETLTPCFQLGEERDEATRRLRGRGVLFSGTSQCDGYRVPTIGEWRAAAKGSIADFYLQWGAGNKVTMALAASKMGWVSSNSNQRARVAGSFQANERGLYDLYGNVMELVLPEGDDLVLDTSHLGFLGCSYNSDPRFCDPTEAVYLRLLDSEFLPGLGFRLARSAESFSDTRY